MIDLGGDKADLERKIRLPWDAAMKKVSAALQNVQTPEGRTEALRAVTRKLIAKGQTAQATGLAKLYSDAGPMAASVIGLEVLRSGDKASAEQLAILAEQDFR